MVNDKCTKCNLLHNKLLLLERGQCVEECSYGFENIADTYCKQICDDGEMEDGHLCKPCAEDNC